MPNVHLPAPGQPQVVVESAGEQGILDLEPALVADLYKAHGALLFCDFGVDVADFRAFAAQFCSTSVVNDSPNREPIDRDANIHTVDRGTAAFTLHPELSREPWKPDVAMFACLSAPGRGGQTTICDGVALVRELPEDARRGLEHRRLLYLAPTWPALLAYWLGTPHPTGAQLAAPPPSCPYFFRRYPDVAAPPPRCPPFPRAPPPPPPGSPSSPRRSPDGQIVSGFPRPALHKPMFTDAPAFGNFLLFARFSRGRSDNPLLDDGQPVPEAWLQAVKATGDRL